MSSVISLADVLRTNMLFIQKTVVFVSVFDGMDIDSYTKIYQDAIDTMDME